MTKNNDTGRLTSSNWNEPNLNSLNEDPLEGKSGASSRGNPAPVAYIKVAVVKKLVVGFLA